jgi:hypothetical protein
MQRTALHQPRKSHIECRTSQVSIENLLKVVPAPAVPGQAFSGPWGPVEAEIGVSLPQDYKDFCAVYGRGYFMEFLGVDVPRSPNPHTRLETQIEQICEMLSGDDGPPHPPWPAPGGLIPFGRTDNGEVLLWRPSGETADWGVAIWDGRGQAFEAFDCDLTDFLAGLATGAIRPEAFPDDFLPCEQLFEPNGPLHGPGALDALIGAVPPPATPLCPFDDPWEPVEARLGTELPADYKEIVRLYGQGWFMDFLSIAVPGEPEQRGSLEGEQDMARDMINAGMPTPYPIWPKPGGLLNVGLTKANDRVFWRTRGPPSEWRIIVWDREAQALEALDCNLAGFLAGLAKGEVQPESFNGRMLYRDASFTPGEPPWSPNLGDPDHPVERKGIGALTAIVPPPGTPFRPFTGPWKPLEAYLGTELPQDYKDFSRLYGSGLFMDFLIVYVPEIQNSRLTLEPQVREAPMMFSSQETLPYPFWPHVAGLIRFGCTDFGDQLYWLPEGEPDDWKVVMWQRHGPYDQAFEKFDCGMAEFLGGLADGTVVPRAYSEGLERYEPMFQPHSDLMEG